MRLVTVPLVAYELNVMPTDAPPLTPSLNINGLNSVGNALKKVLPQTDFEVNSDYMWLKHFESEESGGELFLKMSAAKFTAYSNGRYVVKSKTKILPPLPSTEPVAKINHKGIWVKYIPSVSQGFGASLNVCLEQA